MTVWIVAGLAALAAALLVPRVAVQASAFANRRERERDDAVFFQKCMTSSPRWNRVNRALPAPPRCRICYAPFGGLGFVLGVRPSRQNPNYCDSCFEKAPAGGHEMELGVLVARVSIAAAVASDRDPAEVSEFAHRFERRTAEVLADCDAIIETRSGVGVVGLFLPVMATLGDRTCSVMVDAARRIVGDEAGPVTVGLDFGTAVVGNVGASGMKELTALGDPVDGAVRCQRAAEPGQIVVSDDVRRRVPDPDDLAGLRTL